MDCVALTYNLIDEVNFVGMRHVGVGQLTNKFK